MTHQVTIYVDVYDVVELYKAAFDRALEEGASEDVAEDMLSDDGEPDVAQCLRMLFDPGVSPAGMDILDSVAE